jgi:hypothetical protein
MRIRRVLVASQRLRAAGILPSRKALNTAVTCLECDDPLVIAPGSWAAPGLMAKRYFMSRARLSAPL